MQKLFSLIILLYLFVFSCYGLFFYYQLSPVSANIDSNLINTDNNGLFVIKEGEGASSVAERLEDSGLIRSSSAFKLYLLVRGRISKINPGVYDLLFGGNSREIANIITKRGNQENVKITIPEGWTIQMVENKLSEKGVITGRKLTELKIGDFSDKFSFLKEFPQENNLEGLLFPDTYEFETNSLSRDIAIKFLENFEDKFFSNFKEASDKENFSLLKSIIIASLIEAEAPFFEDRVLVSDIIHKRLESNWPLQIDATIVYYKCFIENEGYGCRSLKNSDLKKDSPYNTYTRLGLPVGPIGNPGISAIRAAINSEDSSYWYYISDPKTRKTIFSATLEQHNLARNKYLRR